MDTSREIASNRKHNLNTNIAMPRKVIKVKIQSTRRSDALDFLNLTITFKLLHITNSLSFYYNWLFILGVGS